MSTQLPKYPGFLLLCLFIGLFPGSDVNAQIAKNPSHITYSPGGLLDSVFDHLGHRYSLGEIEIEAHMREDVDKTPKKTTAATCSSGYFQLYLEPGCGLDGTDAASAARLTAVCQVLKDISQFINSPLTSSSTGQKVNIWVRNPSAVGWLPPGFAGVAGSFYNAPISSSVSGIADNAVWITLNSGTDAFKNVTAPLYTSGGTYSYGATFFHGWMAFQCDGTIPWHTDLSTSPATGEIDLYTVALHEMLHSLGFASLIEYNGASRLGNMLHYYDRYDQHLQTLSSAPLITGGASGCGMYGWNFNSSLVPFAVLSPGATTATCPLGYQDGAYVNHTVCTDAVRYVDGVMNQPVYTSACYERGSSLSHFEDECAVPSGFAFVPPSSNDHYFVMSNATRPGPYSATTYPGAMKRFPRPEERTVLCDIGYSVNTTFGNAVNHNYYSYGGSVCTGLQVAGINDGIGAAGAYTFFTSGTTPVAINGGTAGSLLSNDFGAVSFKCLEALTGGTVSLTSGTASTVVTYTPAPGASGVQLLRYIPVGSSGAEGNITYLYVYVGDPLCSPSACDLVLNGGFEHTDPAFLAFAAGAIHCWVPLNADPDLYGRPPTTFYPIPSALCSPPCDVHFPGTSAAIPNDHFLALQGLWSVALHQTESVQEPLASTLVSGNTYLVSCWARVADGGPYCHQPTHLTLAVSPGTTPMVPMPAAFSPYPSGLTTLASFAVPYTPGDHDWHYLSAYVTYTGPDAHTLVAIHNTYLNPLTGPYTCGTALFLLVDDISIRPATAISSFTLPDTLCVGGTLQNLKTSVSIPGGIFSWQADSSGYVITSHDTLFNPASAYSASLILGDTGRAVIGYMYSDVNDCKQTIYKTIWLVNGTVPAITGNLNLCTDVASTLSDAAPGGRWVSSNVTVAIIGATTGLVGTGSAGTTTISYILPNGCYTTAVLTVNPFPVTGGTLVAVGSTITLGYPVSGGTWSSGNTAIATIGSVTGIVTGIAPGTAVISYSVSVDCRVLVVITVTPVTGVIQQPGNATALSLKPNPNNGLFTVSCNFLGYPSQSKISIEIANVLGEVVYRSEHAAGNGLFSKDISLTDNLANGIYFVKARIDGNTQVVRFTLKR